MKFAAAKELITPDHRMHMGGYRGFYGKVFQNIHDDLYVRSLLLDDGKQPVLLLSLDLLFHDQTLTASVRQFASEQYGLLPDHVFVSYTHTHGGPAVSAGYGDPSQCSERYERFLLERVQHCVRRTMCNVYEGTLEYGCVRGDWNINRRRPAGNRITLAPHPDGGKDDVLHVLQLRDGTGRVRATLFNYACHPVTVRDALLISGDFPSRLCQLWEAEHFGATALFFQGAAGNTRPKSTAVGSQFAARTYDEVDDMARSMTQSASRICRDKGHFTPVDPDLAACQFEVSLELEPMTREQIREVAAAHAASSGVVYNVPAILDHYDRLPRVAKLPAGIIRLSGDCWIVCMGGEPCFEVKRNLEMLFGVKHFMFIGYLDYTAYIPDDKIIAEGGYEVSDGVAVDYGWIGRFKPGIDRTIADAYLRHMPARG